MEIFAYDGDVGATGIIDTMTSSLGFLDASTAMMDNETLTDNAELYTPGVTRRYAGISPKAAMIIVETATVNFSLDGTDPTAFAVSNIGLPLAVGESYLITGINNIRNARFINRVDASGSVIKFLLYY